MYKKIALLITSLLILASSQTQANIVFTTTPPNPSPANVPLTFSWNDDCELVTINYGDGTSDTNPATIANTITHVYETVGDYHVDITGNTCITFDGAQDFITVFIRGSGAPPTPGPVTPTPTNVSIERLQLFFDNRLPRITVPSNKTDLQAHARIRYTGSGIFQAYWTVDGRIIERIDRHLISGGTLELSTPEHIPLPTLIDGPHSVQLVVTSPAISTTELPKAVYFVTPAEALYSKPELITPANRFSIAGQSDLDFRWFSRSQPASYRLEIISQDDDKSVFSAYTKQPQYHLKQSLIDNFLQPSTTYSWQVSALDRSGKVVSVSEKNTLSVEAKSWVIDHQFLLIVEDSLLGNSIKLNLINEFQLDVIDEFSLSSLKQAVVVFQTQRDSRQLLNELISRQGVIGAQPDYIYRTSAADSTQEPLQDLLSLSHTLDYNSLHQNMTGAGAHIAIIDTGVELDHPDLQGAKISGQNFIKDESYQGEIHGTAVSGIIAAQANRFGILGIAPQANILALRACRQLQAGLPAAECYSSTLARAMDHAITQQAQLVNFSFGTPAADPLMTSLIDYSHGQGIWLIASAGNDRQQQQLSFPASHSSVIAVAGMDGQQPYPSQLLADRADLLAPAEQIFSSVSGGRHNFLNGTSMSTAIVSGIVALAIPGAGQGGLNLRPEQREFCTWVNPLLHREVCRSNP